MDNSKAKEIVGKYYVMSRKGLSNMVEVKKKLKYENSVVYTEMFKDEKLQVKVLEGMLRATEERLKFFLEKEES